MGNVQICVVGSVIAKYVAAYLRKTLSIINALLQLNGRSQDAFDMLSFLKLHSVSNNIDIGPTVFAQWRAQ